MQEEELPSPTRPVPVLEGLPSSNAFQTKYLRRHRPVVLKGAAPFLVPKAWALFHADDDDNDEGGSSSRWMARLANILEDAVVDVATTHWALPFSGDPGMAESTTMPFPTFVSLLRQMQQRADDDEAYGGTFASCHSGGQNYYLAQAPILEHRRKGKGKQPPAPLAALAPHIDQPEALVDPKEVVQVNLWMGGRPTATTLHYDSNHNLLVVLRGAKQVQLLPPSATPALDARPVYTASANHSSVEVPAQPEELFGTPRMDTGPHRPWLARVEAGDVLFLPEGWWHQVDSAARTVALNYWVAGFVESVLEGGGAGEQEEEGEEEEEEEEGDGDGMVPFYLRAVVQRAVERERGRLLAQAVQKARADCRRALGRSATATDALSGQDWRRLLDQGLAAVAASNAGQGPPAPQEERTQAPKQVPPLLEAVLRCMPFSVQREELPRAVRAMGADTWLGRVLLNLSPVTVEALTATWEAAEQEEAAPEGGRRMRAFFAKIYGEGPGGSQHQHQLRELITLHLFKSKGHFAKEALNRALGL